MCCAQNRARRLPGSPDTPTPQCRGCPTSIKGNAALLVWQKDITDALHKLREARERGDTTLIKQCEERLNTLIEKNATNKQP